MRRGAFVVAIAVGVLPATAVSAASAAHSCPSFTEHVHRGQHRVYTVRVHNIAATRVGCDAASKVIRRFDRKLLPGPAIWDSVPPWKCEWFKPFSVANGQPENRNQCTRSGDHHIRWTETEVSGKYIAG